MFQTQDFQNISLARVISFNSKLYFFVKNKYDEEGRECKKFELYEFEFNVGSKYEFLESKENNCFGINPLHHKFDVKKYKN
jgi:hypothetical protein